MIDALILKEKFDLTDEELLESIVCAPRFQYALHTTSFIEQPFSEHSFRERLYLYTLETGIGLLYKEMESMAKVFVKYMDINPAAFRGWIMQIHWSPKFAPYRTQGIDL